jgi:crossover junction endodeoxyribonuclease RuvC
LTILGIDPGYAIVGYGVIRPRGARFEPLGAGAIRTPAGMPFEARLDDLYTGILSVIERYKPDAMAVEQLFFTTNQKTVILVAQARGVILLAAQRKGLPVYQYTPLQVKSAVVGYGKAEKHQVMEMTRQILGLKSVPKPDDVADALAVAICHGHTAGSLLGRTPSRVTADRIKPNMR